MKHAFRTAILLGLGSILVAACNAAEATGDPTSESQQSAEFQPATSESDSVACSPIGFCLPPIQLHCCSSFRTTSHCGAAEERCCWGNNHSCSNDADCCSFDCDNGRCTNP